MNHPGLLTFAVTAATIALLLSLPSGGSGPTAEAAIRSSWSSAAPEWRTRLVQDETQRVCSQYRNAPPKDVAQAIMARERAGIVYPADGQLAGDWQKGRQLAQS